MDLILGIDFGTSCSKVVIGDPGWQGLSYAVPVGGDQEGLARFLRTTLVNSGGINEANLKLRLMESPTSAENRDLATLYLAGVIRDSIRWFTTDGPSNYVGKRLVWSLNLGFPAKQVDGGPIKEAYELVAREAAMLADSDLPLDRSSLASLRMAVRSQSSNQTQIPASRINLYPEIAAQLAGYVNSPYRQEGSLILIDVGAGTLDVSTIILHGNHGRDIVSFHFCEVGHYGVLRLLETRLAALGNGDPGFVRNMLAKYQQGTVAVPDDPQQLLGSGSLLSPAMKNSFGNASEKFAKDAIALALKCASRFRRRQKDAHDNPAFEPWGDQLRFFFTGGGSRSTFFRHHFTGGPFEAAISPFTRWRPDAAERRRLYQGLRLEPLPAPDELRGFPKQLTADFDRMSVAHGLAFGKEDLMRITASTHS